MTGVLLLALAAPEAAAVPAITAGPDGFGLAQLLERGGLFGAGITFVLVAVVVIWRSIGRELVQLVSQTSSNLAVAAEANRSVLVEAGKLAELSRLAAADAKAASEHARQIVAAHLGSTAHEHAD